MRHTCQHGYAELHTCDCPEIGRDHTADQYDDLWMYWRRAMAEEAWNKA